MKFLIFSYAAHWCKAPPTLRREGFVEMMIDAPGFDGQVINGTASVNRSTNGANIFILRVANCHCNRTYKCNCNLNCICAYMLVHTYIKLVGIRRHKNVT